MPHLNQKETCLAKAFVHLQDPCRIVIATEQEKSFSLPCVLSLLASRGLLTGGSSDGPPLQCAGAIVHIFHIPRGRARHADQPATQTRRYPARVDNVALAEM